MSEGHARRLILGTAGHIDHGKTALVHALTGVDTDRLQEEKSRGITIDLGFADLVLDDVHFGVVDVPGHEGFVRNMVAGATGVDVVLLVVAADEGIMPQTREHLAIVRLLGVTRLVVALTKVDLVEDEWLELVTEDVRDHLAGTPWGGAPVLPTSARTGEGLEALKAALAGSAPGPGEGRGDPEDLLFLPVDRSFTVQGTGTVVTGTLWSGAVRTGDRLRVLPAGLEARVRGIQRHGADADDSGPGTRTAVALTGDAVTTDSVTRGQVLVDHGSWPPSRMLTVQLEAVPGTGWTLEQGQRVRVHLGTAEVMARVVLFGRDALAGEERGWGQLRLEAPVAARARQAFVLRSYSPMTTIAGGRVAEPHPPKRRPGSELPEDALAQVLEGGPRAAVVGALRLAGPPGVAGELLPVATGLPPAVVRDVLRGGEEERPAVQAGDRWVGQEVCDPLRDDLLRAVDQAHEDEPWKPGVPVEALRARVHPRAPDGLGSALIQELAAAGALDVQDGTARRPGFRVRFTPAQDALLERLREVYREAALEPPALDDLPPELRGDPAFPWLLRALEDEGAITALEPELYLWTEALAGAIRRTVEEFGGRSGLGPADFRAVIPVSRRYLLPILRHLDGRGITRFHGEGRSVEMKIP